MVSVQASRFALLKIDDDVEEEKSPVKSDDNKQKQNSQANAKKKNKKKKKAEQNQELRNIAFGGGGSGKARPTSSNKGGGGGNHGDTRGSGGISQADWDTWLKKDKQFATDVYEQDLEKAILESKLQFEEKKKTDSDLKAQGITVNGGEADKGKRKKKKAARRVPMTLDEFKQMQEEKQKHGSSSSEEDNEALFRVDEPTTHILDPDSKYFAGVSEEVLKILRKEKMQEAYQKQYSVENVRVQKFKDEIDKRDDELVTLRRENKAMKEELQQVKKRNQQLCVILSQGEMKDKTAILKELEELKQVHSELTQEVSRLHTQLQKERSKGGKPEGAKAKAEGGKGKGKNK